MADTTDPTVTNTASALPERMPKVNKKKGKRFANLDGMLKMVDSINSEQEQKISHLLARDTQLLKYWAQKEASRKTKTKAKTERVSQLKSKLGTNKHSKETSATPSSTRQAKERKSKDSTKHGSVSKSDKGSTRSAATKKRVSFKS